MLGSRDQQVVSTIARDRDVRGVERLGVDQAIHRIKSEFAKLRGSHVAGGQDRFIQILAGAGDVVVVGQHIGGGHGGIDSERSRVAGDASGRIAHGYRELRPVVRGGGRWSGVAGGGRASYGGSAFLPLVVQRGGARRRD